MKKEISLALELLGYKLRFIFQIRQNSFKFLEGRDKKIISGFKKGHSIPHLAKVFSLTPNRVSQILINHGAREPKWRKMTLKKRNSVFQLRKKGLSHSAIGRKLGVTRERIRQILDINKGIEI